MLRGIYTHILKLHITICTLAAARVEILQNDAAIVETVQRYLGQNAVSRIAFNCDEIYVDQIADANNGENLLSR